MKTIKTGLKNGKPFTLKRFENSIWLNVQVGDIIRFQDSYYKVVAIAPTEVTLELIEKETTL